LTKVKSETKVVRKKGKQNQKKIQRSKNQTRDKKEPQNKKFVELKQRGGEKVMHTNTRSERETFHFGQ